MAQPKPPKEQRFKEAPAFQFYHYSSIDEAEQRSGNIGFPIFSCQWLDDGTVLLGGGGGSKGRDVRSAIVSCRLVNGVAVDSFLPQQALIDPLSLASGSTTLPSLPMLQAVGEVTTADDIVSALNWSSSTLHNTSILAAGAGSTSILFDLQGFGSLASSPLPACRDLNQTSGENLDYFRQVQQNTLTTNPEAAASFTKPTLPFSTPFKSPLLSNCLTLPQTAHKLPLSSLGSQSNLAQVISQLTRDGKRSLNAKIRFRSDFSTGDSFVSCVKLSSCGNIFYSGGQDGVIRAWWITDPELMSTYITRGVKRATEGDNSNSNSNSNDISSPFALSNHRPSGGNAGAPTHHGTHKLIGITETPQKLVLTEHSLNPNQQSPSPHQVGYVSPLFIPVAYRSQGIKDFDISEDGRVMTVVDDKGGLSLWSLPTFDDIRQNGTRIPIDYVNEKGEIVEYPFESKRAATGKNHHGSVHETEYDMSQSRSAAFYGIENIHPLVDLKNNQVNHIKALFWSPPIVDHVVPRTNNFGGHFAGIKPFFDDNTDDENDDEEIVVPPNLPQIVTELNKHPSRNTPHYILLTLVTQGRDSTWFCKHILEPGQQNPASPSPSQFNSFISSQQPQPMKLRLSTQLHVFNDASGTQMAISPNKHFIAVSGNDLHIYTSLDIPYIRTMHLLALNQSNSFNLSQLPPLSLVDSKQRCFSLPCTGLTFDPSSRLLLASSASRAITFLPVKATKKETALDNMIFNFSRFCCPMYYLCCFHLCCKPRRRKPQGQGAPPPKPSKCRQKCDSITSWITFLLFFGWLFSLCGFIKSKICCRNANYQRELLNKAIMAQNQRDNSLFGSSSLTIVNAVLLCLVILFISQFVTEFGQQ